MMRLFRQITALWLSLLLIPSPQAVAQDILRRGHSPRPSVANQEGAGGTSDGGDGGIQAPVLPAGDVLARNSRILQDMMRMQDAARAAATAGGNNLGLHPHGGGRLPDVPNGLGSGGLEVKAGDAALWQGAQLPGQKTSEDGKVLVTIEQTAAQALLDWETFNLGKDTVLEFDQSAGGSDQMNWTAFNRVDDPSGNPTQILGSIKAPGQVYVINRNGVIFGGSSQVNVRSLVASALPVNYNLIERGLLNNPSAQFLFSGLDLPPGIDDMPAFQADRPYLENGRFGDVQVMAGARIISEVAEDGGGGRIMLVGANVENKGILDAASGQTILAAGLQVGITAHDSNDPSLRGLDVFVGAIADPEVPLLGSYAGTVRNQGLIRSPRGNVTLTGRSVEMGGFIDSSTSVALNGSVRLMASYGAVSNPRTGGDIGTQHAYFLNRETGSVRIDSDAVIQILPEWESEATVAASELPLRSQMLIEGRSIYFGEDSTLLAHGGEIDIYAGIWDQLGAGSSARALFVHSDGQIYLDRGATISAAGSAGVVVPAAQALITVELRGSELADSPVQRDSALRGKAVTVDIRRRGVFNGVEWVGSPIANLAGHMDLIERGVGELTADGGDVRLNAGGSIVMQEGALIDVSAGWIQYEGEAGATTRLIDGGRLVDIADANPRVRYDGIYDGKSHVDSVRWGQRLRYSNPLNPAGPLLVDSYVYGADGGSLDLIAAGMALDGSLRGMTVEGERQREIGAGHSSLTIAFEAQDLSLSGYPVYSPTPPTVIFAETDDGQTPVGAFSPDIDGSAVTLPEERLATVYLSPELLSEEGFGQLVVRNRDGGIEIGVDTAIRGPDQGSLTLHGSDVTVDGTIAMAGGKVDLRAYAIGLDTVNRLARGALRDNPVPEAGRGGLYLGSKAVIDTSGSRVDDRLPESRDDPRTLRGGVVSLQGYDSVLMEGSRVDVSGGFQITPQGAIHYADAGQITIEGGRDLEITSVLGGTLTLGAKLSGYSGAGGGSLSILDTVIHIGGEAHAGAGLQVDNDFFSEGGFAHFSLRGIGQQTETYDVYTPGVTIHADTHVRPEVKSLRVELSPEGYTIQRALLEEGQRSAPHLEFGATGANNPYAGTLLVRGEVVLEEQAVIETDAGGSVTFDANSVDIRGSVIAPGGLIRVTGGSEYNSVISNDTHARSTVHIGGNAQLLATGTVVYQDNVRGLNLGQVFGGGEIRLEGNIVTRSGALLDASGTRANLDVPVYFVPDSLRRPDAWVDGLQYQPAQVDSRGGSIHLNGGSLLVSHATLRAEAGGENASGGTLEVRSGRMYGSGETTTTADTNMEVRQVGPVYSEQLTDAGTGAVVYAMDGNALKGQGYFAVDTFEGKGFDHLVVGGNVRFDGPVRIDDASTLRIADGGVVEATEKVDLNAQHIHVGQDFMPPRAPEEEWMPFTQDVPGVGVSRYSPVVSHGSGMLHLAAEWIDTGTLLLQSIGSARFNAGGGNIRGNGVVNIAGDLHLSSSILYPTTAATLTLVADDYHNVAGPQQGTITFSGSGDGTVPLSAAGTLNVYASIIKQAGVLRAPAGVIHLGWDGSGDAPMNPISGQGVQVTDAIYLADDSLTSVSAVDGGGRAYDLPYGRVLNGISWIDPRGVDITLEGPPEKAVNLAARSIVSSASAEIDLRGGGDLSAYRWIPGVGGTRDILESSTSFAVLPDYALGYAPYAPFNTGAGGSLLKGDRGYVNASLRAGDSIYLSGDSGLPAGTYTLLPARYALMPGAFLVTPHPGSPVGSDTAVRQADGSSLVSGFRIDGNRGVAVSSNLLELFEVSDHATVMQRAEYAQFGANAFFAHAAQDRDWEIPRLPQDSAQLVFSATERMQLDGILRAAPETKGRGSMVDINSSLNILIGNGQSSPDDATLYLESEALSAFGEASLLIGGRRSFADGVTVVEISSKNVTLDNAGAPLLGADVLLVASEEIDLRYGAAIAALPMDDRLGESVRIGDAEQPGSGDGLLVRVTGLEGGVIERAGVSSSTVPQLTIGEQVQIEGRNVVLDSTGSIELDSSAQIVAEDLSLGSGRISVVLGHADESQIVDSLVLSGEALQSIMDSVRSLRLSSYSTLDFHGKGTLGSSAVGELRFNAPLLRGFAADGGEIRVAASELTLENTTGNAVLSKDSLAATGSLFVESKQWTQGEGAVAVRGFEQVVLQAEESVWLQGEGGLSVTGDLTVQTPRVVSAAGTSQSVDVEGDFVLEQSTLQASSPGAVAGTGLGSQWAVQAAAVTVDNSVYLPGGRLELSALSGDVVIGEHAAALLDVSTAPQVFFDRSVAIPAGDIVLRSAGGSVRIGEAGVLNLSATSSAAGSLSIEVPQGDFVSHGLLRAEGVQGGRFGLDIHSAVEGSLAYFDQLAQAGGFSGQRDYRVRRGNVQLEGQIQSSRYSVSADDGDIQVSGTIDSSGQRGGWIALRASGDVVVEEGAVLTVAAAEVDNAGKGGAIYLEAGAQREGQFDGDARVDIRAGSTIDLSVSGSVADASRGEFSGVLYLRAPQNESGTDLGVETIDGTIVGASYISVEGYRLYDLTDTSGEIKQELRQQIQQDGRTLLGASGSESAGYAALLERLHGGNEELRDLLVVRPGAEIIHRSGDLSLGSSSSSVAADWDLSGFRYGPRAVPGMLTLRAAGDLLFYNALSDGFSGGSHLWLSPLMHRNERLPSHVQSWSYRLTAGADLSAVDYSKVVDAADGGSVLLGKNGGAVVGSGGANAQTSALIGNLFQVIRTGSGYIDIAAAGNVRLLNPFASIYTAGTQVSDPTHLYQPGDFALPQLRNSGIFQLPQGILGALQQNYPVQYSLAGGNVHVSAGGRIERLTRNNRNEWIADSSRQIPTNWLYRRGYVAPDGRYGAVEINAVLASLNDPSASTSWWVDFSQFFQGVGALGGGNVQLIAGEDIANVDAVIPTNARAPSGVPDLARMVELGGGDLTVRAGRNIDGGVYYVERGVGRLHAEGAIHTNATRSIHMGILDHLNNPQRLPESTWLPTTLFLGKGQFDVSARSDVLIGPVSNPFLLPQGLGNRYWYKTYFSTYAPDSAVRLTSLTGDVRLQSDVILPDSGQVEPFLQAWVLRQNLFGSSTAASYFQPWLRLNETSVQPFARMLTVAAPTLQMTSFSGDIELAANLNLFPSPVGTVELLAGGTIHALNQVGVSSRVAIGQTAQIWQSSTLNLSDANPASLPGVRNPFSYYTLVGGTPNLLNATQNDFLQDIDRIYAENGSVNNVLQTQQALHDSKLLHRNDTSSLYIYATGGDISGLTLFAGKVARVIAGRDITDISLYLQNNTPDQATLVAAGRDIVLYNPIAPRRLAVAVPGNLLARGQQPLGGDIQLGGPGALQVLAGRNLDLGIGDTNNDGTSVGITTIGNRRNPFLPDTGAEIVAAAGIGPNMGLVSSAIDFPAFIADFLDPNNSTLAERYLPQMGALMELPQDADVWAAFSELSEPLQARLALSLFYQVLRDAGRDYNDPDADHYRQYTLGFAAIDALFPGEDWGGDLTLTSRQFKTLAGGDIHLLTPGGGITVGFPVAGARPDQGILTESGGNIYIFSDRNVDVGSSRIFTLRGGNEIIWSTRGDIAAGSAARTIRSAPPTRVVVDTQTATVTTDLSGLATGGGIGVLQTVPGMAAGDVDLIAPEGTVDAGDAGIRVSGNINIAAVEVMNAGNIETAGTSAGVPSVAPSIPDVGGLASASASASAAVGGGEKLDSRQETAAVTRESVPSLVTVEVIGFGGTDPEDEEEG